MSRLKTFYTLPSTSYQNKYLLAEGGFTYIETDYITQCFFGDLVLNKREKDDDV